MTPKIRFLSSGLAGSGFAAFGSGGGVGVGVACGVPEPVVDDGVDVDAGGGVGGGCCWGSRAQATVEGPTTSPVRRHRRTTRRVIENIDPSMPLDEVR